jgi:hypothetical protein
MFSRLPEADQRAILRQANDQEFERYITHAHMKLRKPVTMSALATRRRRLHGTELGARSKASGIASMAGGFSSIEVPPHCRPTW